MAISTKLVKFKRQLKIAQAREAYKKSQLEAAIAAGETTAYTSRGDTVDYYVPSIGDPNELYIKVSVPQTSLTQVLGGYAEPQITLLGGVLTLPEKKAYVQQRGFSNQSVSYTHLTLPTTSRV